jgi:DNA-binding NarL/FixJ family response regulator
MKKIKVMIVDDHALVQAGLKQLLEVGDDIEVIATADSGSGCLELLESISPDIIFMDIKMHGITGVEATRVISKKCPNVRVIMLTIYDDDEYVMEAVHAGAKGYILKNVTREKLMDVVRCVMADKAFLDPSVTQSFINRMKNTNPVPMSPHAMQLTKRELEVIEGICAGKIDDDIAGSLHISKHTVRSHIKNIYRKLDVSSKCQLITKAIQQGIVSVEIPSGRKCRR